MNYRSAILNVFRSFGIKKGQSLPFQSMTFPLHHHPGYSGEACRATVEAMLVAGDLSSGPCRDGFTLGIDL